MEEKCTKTSGVLSSGTIMPNPRAALNHFTVPSAMALPHLHASTHLRESPGNRQRHTACVIQPRLLSAYLLLSPAVPDFCATTPALPIGKAGVVARLFAPRDVWIGTLGTAQNAMSFTTGPSTPGRSSAVSFEVQPRSGNARSPDDPASGRRSAQVRQARCLTSFGRTTLRLRLWTLRVRSDRSKAKSPALLWVCGGHHKEADGRLPARATRREPADRCRYSDGTDGIGLVAIHWHRLDGRSSWLPHIL